MTLGATAINAPADVSFAATGKRAGARARRRVDRQGTPATPVATAAQGRSLQVGDAVHVVNTSGQGLRVRDIPSREGKILVKFVEGSTVQIIGGPKQADGYTWWKVRGAAGEGWCAADFLAHEP